MSSALKSRRGFTLVEVVISVAVLTVTLGSVALISKQGSEAWRMNMSIGALDAKTERSLDRIIRFLETASGADLQPNLTVVAHSDWIDFQEIIGYSAGNLTLGETRSLELELSPGELDNGVDDNGNGLIDETRVVLVENPGQPNERRVTIARNVSEFLEGEFPNGNDDNGNGLDDEPGLCFDLTDDTLNVRLSMQKIGPDGNLLVRTLESSVTLLN